MCPDAVAIKAILVWRTNHYSVECAGADADKDCTSGRRTVRRISRGGRIDLQRSERPEGTEVSLSVDQGIYPSAQDTVACGLNPRDGRSIRVLR